MRGKVFLALALAAFLVPPGISAEGPPYPPDIQAIKTRGKLVVAMYAKDVQPFLMTDAAGELQGFDVDIARGMARALGVGIEFDRQAQTFNQICERVAARQADLGISLISRTLTRAERVRFSNPYVILHPVLVMNRVTASRRNVDPRDPLKALANVAEKIAEKKGTSYVGFAAAMFPKATVVEYPEWDDVFEAVRQGKAFAAVRDEIGVKNYLFASPEKAVNLQISTILDPRRNDPLAIAVHPDSSHLLQWINLYLETNVGVKTAEDLIKAYGKYYAK